VDGVTEVLMLVGAEMATGPMQGRQLERAGSRDAVWTQPGDRTISIDGGAPAGRIRSPAICLPPRARLRFT